MPPTRPNVQILIDPPDAVLASPSTPISARPPPTMQSLRFTPGSASIRAKTGRLLQEIENPNAASFRPLVNNPTERRLSGRERREQVLAYHVGASLLKQYDEEQQDAAHAKEAHAFGVFGSSTTERPAALFIPEDQLESLRRAVRSYQIKHNRVEHEAISLDLYATGGGGGGEVCGASNTMSPPSQMPPPSSPTTTQKRSGNSPQRLSPARAAADRRSPPRRGGGASSSSNGGNNGGDASAQAHNRMAAIIRDVFNYKFDFFEKRRAELQAREEAHREKQEEERRRAVESGRRLHRRKRSRQHSAGQHVENGLNIGAVNRATSDTDEDDLNDNNDDDDFSEEEQESRRRQRVAQMKEEKLRKFMRHVILDRFACPPDVVDAAIARWREARRDKKLMKQKDMHRQHTPNTTAATPSPSLAFTQSDALALEPPAQLSAYLLQSKQLLDAVRCAADLIVFTAMRVLPPLLYYGDIASFDDLKRQLEKAAPPPEIKAFALSATTVGMTDSIMLDKSLGSHGGSSMAESMHRELREKGDNPQKLRADKALSVPCAMRLFELAVSSQPSPTVAAVNSGVAERTAREKQLRILENKRVVNHPTQAVAEKHNIWLSLTTPRILRPPLHTVNAEKLLHAESGRQPSKSSDDDGSDDDALDFLEEEKTNKTASENGTMKKKKKASTTTTSKSGNSLYDPEPSLLPITEVLQTTSATQLRQELSPYEVKLLLMLSTAHAAFVHSLCADDESLSHAERRLVENHREDLTCVAADVIVESAVAYAESLTTNPNRTLPAYASRKDGRRQSTVDEYAEKLWEDHQTTREELEELLSMLDTNPFLKGHDAERVALQLLHENRLVVKEVLTRMKGELKYMMTGIDDRASVLDWDRTGIQREKRHQVQKKERRLSASRRQAQSQCAQLGIGEPGALVLAGAKSALSAGSFGDGNNKGSEATDVAVVVYDLPCANFREMMDEMEQSDSDNDVVVVPEDSIDPETLAAAVAGNKSKVGIGWMQRMPRKPRVAHPPSVAHSRHPPAVLPGGRGGVGGGVKHGGTESLFSSVQRDGRSAENINTNSNNNNNNNSSSNPLGVIASASTGPTAEMSLTMDSSVSTTPRTGTNRPARQQAVTMPRQSTVVTSVPTVAKRNPSTLIIRDETQCFDEGAAAQPPPSPRGLTKGGPESFARRTRGSAVSTGQLTTSSGHHPQQQQLPVPVAKDLTLAALQRELVLLDRQRRQTNKQRSLDGYGASNKPRNASPLRPGSKAAESTSNNPTSSSIPEAMVMDTTTTGRPSSSGGPTMPALPLATGKSSSSEVAGAAEGVSVTASVVGKKEAATVEKLKVACLQTMQHCLSNDDALLWYQQGSKRQSNNSRGGGGVATTQQGTFDLYALSPITRMRLTVPSDIVECPSATMQKSAGYRHRQLVHWTL